MTEQRIELSAETQILVVTENHDDSDQIRRHLKTGGLNAVLVVQSAMQAYAAWRDKKIEVAIIDQAMTNPTGWQLIVDMKTDERLPNFAAILFGRKDSVVADSDLRTYGIPNFLKVPCSLKDLMQCVVSAHAGVVTKGGIENRYTNAKHALVQSDTQSAISQYKDLRQTTGTDRSAIGLAHSYVQGKQLSQAAATLNEVADPSQTPVMIMRMRLAMQQGEMAEAKTVFDELIVRAVGNEVLLLEINKTCVGYRQYSMAKITCERAIQGGFQSEEFMLGLARAEFEIGNHAGALEALARAVKVFGESLKILNIKGQLLRSMEKHQEALNVYMQASAMSPDEPRILFNIGLCHLSLGNKVQAKQILTRCVQLSPNFIVAKQKLAELIAAGG